MGKQRLFIAAGLAVGLTGLGFLLHLFSPGLKATVEWRGIVFEALLLLFIFFWNLTVLAHFQSTKTLSLGSLFFLVASFADVHDEFFIQPFWVNIAFEDTLRALGAGLIGLGIWFWVKEKEQLLEQLQTERDFEASLIPKLSHDLRAPLTNLIGMTSIMEENPKVGGDPALLSQLEVMARGAREMNLLIDNILETHRLKSGKVQLRPKPISLFSLLEEACKDFHYQAKQKQLTLYVDRSCDGLVVEADQMKVLRIVQNLLGNAIKFSPKGGKITVKALCEDGEVTVRVSDEGPGIPADQAPKILQGVSTHRKDGEAHTESFGIGLKVVREFVSLHGGRFWIEPNLPKGSQFCFTLPLRQTNPNLKSKIQNRSTAFGSEAQARREARDRSPKL